MDEEQEKPGGRKPQFDWRSTVGRRKKFLEVLAETYDVEAALVEGRLTWPQVCELRVRHPDFAERFEEVIAAGYDRLEAMLLRQAGVGAAAVPDPALAQALIKMRRTARSETGPRGSRRKGLARPQLIKAIVDELAPLKAARAGGMMNGQAKGGPPGGGAGGGG